MIRDAARYGAWAAFLAFVTTAIAYTAAFVTAEVGFRPSFVVTVIATLSLLAAFAAMLAAFMGWAMLHRRGRRHGLIGYGFLATGVVIIAQLLISLPFAVLAEATPRMIAWAGAKTFVMHSWYTIPIALAGTALFVRWLRRRAEAPPSPVARAGSRS